MDNLHDIVVDSIKQGVIEGHKRYSQLFTDDFQFWRNLAAQKKATEYFLTVHTAERLYEKLRENSIIVCPEMQFKEIASKCYTAKISPDKIFDAEFKPTESTDKRKVDIAILQEISDDPCPSKNKVVYVVEIKSINQSRKEIVNDVIRLQELISMHESNTIKSAFAIYLAQKKNNRIISDEFMNKEVSKINSSISERKVLNDNMMVHVSSFTALEQDEEYVQQDSENFARDDSRSIELYGFLVEITRN